MEGPLSSLATMRPYDIAIDAYSRLMFWSCEGHDVINITRLDYGGNFEDEEVEIGREVLTTDAEGHGYVFSNVYDDRISQEDTFDYDYDDEEDSDEDVIVGSLLRDAVDKPRSIAVHPYKSLVFWVNLKTSSALIERSR